MPGLAGVFSRRDEEECVQIVDAMLSSMRTEHSYVSGRHCAPQVGTYVGWLAHEESLAANISRQESIAGIKVVLAGEMLLPTRIPWTAGYTEAGNHYLRDLVRLYEMEGESLLPRLNGLFCGLIIDSRRRRSVLFNDRYGVERIYYYEKEGICYFASEAKALLRVLPELRAFDDEGVADFLAYGCSLGGRTLFRNLRHLPGGSAWTFHEGGNDRGRYFQPIEWSNQRELSEEEFATEYAATFNRILPSYLASDSKVGISLTGGLDTRMIMACLHKDASKAICYTFDGPSGMTLDSRVAARVADACGLEHRILRIGDDFLRNFGWYVDRTAFVTDGCAGALTAHEIYLNALASRLSPIRLTGNYGSEILRGVSTFKPVSLGADMLNARYRRLMESAAEGAIGGGLHRVAFAAFREIPWSLYGSLAAGRSQLTFRTPYLDNELVALAFRAPANARQSPGAALSLIKHGNPALAGIPTDRGLLFGGRGLAYWGRRLFSEATFKLDYLHKEGLPDWLCPMDSAIGMLSKFGLLGHHKFLPYRIWFRRDVSEYVRSVLSDPCTRRMAFWEPTGLQTALEDHLLGRRNRTRDIHAILTLEAVERVLLKDLGVYRVSDAAH